MKKKRIFVSLSLIASLALSISEAVSRVRIETKSPLLKSGVADLRDLDTNSERFLFWQGK